MQLAGASPGVADRYDSRASLSLSLIHIFYVYPRIEPVPTLSFAVRHLGTSAGIVLTASHNPAKYNGYKVYNDNGGQITDEAAAEISANIARVSPFLSLIHIW